MSVPVGAGDTDTVNDAAVPSVTGDVPAVTDATGSVTPSSSLTVTAAELELPLV